MSAGKFECLKYSFRQSKDGVVIAMLIHPSDVSPELMALPIGARVEIEWTECTDEEPASSDGGLRPPSSKAAAPQSGEETAAPSHKERGHFADLSPTIQAVLRCKDVRFQRWMLGPDVLANEADAAVAVQEYCGVKSRGTLNTDKAAARVWVRLNGSYDAWLADQSHGALAR